MQALPEPPADWQVAPIESLMTKVRAGGTPKRGTDKYWDGDIPFVKIEDITRSGGFVAETSESITDEGIEDSSAWLVSTSSVLLTMYGTIGVPAILLSPMATNQAIIALVPGDRLDRDYLYFALKKWGPAMERLNVQSTQKNISARIVKAFELPVPPLPEQRAIARVLRAVQQAREATEQVIDAARELKRSLMRHLFTHGPVRVGDADPTPLSHLEFGSVPSGWDVEKLEEHSTIRYGLGQPPKGDPKDLPMIRAGNVKRGRLDRDNLMMVNSSRIPKGRDPIVNTGEIVVVRRGAYTGDSAIVTEDWAGSAVGYDMIVTPGAGLHPNYLAYYFQSEMAWAYFNSQRSRAAQPGLNRQQLGATPVPVPDSDVQGEVATFLQAVDVKIRSEVQHREALGELFSSMLSELMSGRRRVPESMWESAA